MPLIESEAKFLHGISGLNFSIVAGLRRPESEMSVELDCIVPLLGFQKRHVELCLLRDGRATESQLAAVRETLEDLTSDDGTVVPMAAYTWLSQTFEALP